MQPNPRAPHALALLGCVVHATAAPALVGGVGGAQGPERALLTEGLAEGAARRRVLAAAEHWRRTPEAERPAVVIASGGRSWEGRIEADAMAKALAALGVPEERIVRERLSHTTRENARYVAAECARRGIDRVAIVSCVWHLPRAVRLFEAQGLEVIAQVPARDVPRSWARSLWLGARERMLLALAGR